MPAPAHSFHSPAAHTWILLYSNTRVGVKVPLSFTGGHETEDQMQSQRPEQRNAVDVAVEELAAQREEGAVQDEEEERAVEVRIVHYVRRGCGERVEDRECLYKYNEGTRVSNDASGPDSRRRMEPVGFLFPDLGSYMSEIDSQFLQQRRLALIPFSPKRGEPPCSQPALFAHAPTNGRAAAEGSSGGVANADAISWICCCWVGRGTVPAVGGLGGRGVPGDLPGRAVGGWIELQILRRGARGGCGVVAWVVVLGHGWPGRGGCCAQGAVMIRDAVEDL